MKGVVMGKHGLLAGALCATALLLASPARAETRSCSSKTAERAETAVDGVKSWKDAHRWFSDYAPCDDGAISESMSDVIGMLLAEHWPEFEKFELEVKSDAKFRAFIVEHVDETLADDVLERIVQNVDAQCSEKLSELCRAIAAAALSPPEVSDESLKGKLSSTKSRLALKFSLGSTDIMVEETKLADVQLTVGLGAIHHHGDAGESAAWLCYLAPSATKTQRLWIMSGEIGGSDHRVMGAAAHFVGDKAKPTAFCPELPKDFQPLRFEGGVALGDRKQSLIERLGEPSKTDDEWLIYYHAGKVDKNFDEIGWLMFRLNDDRVAEMHLGKTTTN